MFQHFIEVRQTFDMDVINVKDKMGRKILFTYFQNFRLFQKLKYTVDVEGWLNTKHSRRIQK